MLIPQRSGIVLVLAMGVAASFANAQKPADGGIISGLVRDSAFRPLPGASVVARPGNARATTDSAGRFVLTGLDADHYTVRARKLGFAPEEWDVDLRKSGTVDITLTLEHSMPLLDTVTITAGAECPEFSLAGFACRRNRGGGVFMDYNDIDEHNALYTADLFRDMPGFREVTVSTRSGLVRVAEPSLRSRCLVSLVDGREANAANRIPELPWDLIALEVYAQPESVPHQYQRYIWPQRVGRGGRCSLVVYWTLHARMK